MRRAAAIALVIAIASANASSPYDDLAKNAIAFESHWGVYFRRLFGCQSNETDPANCRRELGTVDYLEFTRARHAAAQLFDLKE